MSLPERQINDILRKFGPKILALLTAIGVFELEGQYDASDVDYQIKEELDSV